MLKLIVAALTVIIILAGCVTEDLGSNTSSVPQRVDLHIWQGLAHLQQGRLAVAQEELELALAVDPDTASAQHAMALLRLKLRRTAVGREYYEPAFGSDPGNDLVRSHYGSHLCALGLHLEGINQLTNALNNPLNPSRHTSHYRIGVCMNLSGRFEEAYEYLTKDLQTQPANGPVLYKATTVCFRLGRLLLARGFQNRYFEQSNAIPDSMLLAVNNESPLRPNLLVQHYAYQLRTSYPDGSQSPVLKQPISSTQSG